MQVTSYGFATKLISFLCLFDFGESRFLPFRFAAFPLVEHNVDWNNSQFSKIIQSCLEQSIWYNTTSPN